MLLVNKSLNYFLLRIITTVHFERSKYMNFSWGKFMNFYMKYCGDDI